MTAPPCGCHGEPMYWHKKKDMTAGGLWRCTVRKREVDRATFMRRYDADPIFRIGHHLDGRRREARRRLARLRNRPQEG